MKNKIFSLLLCLLASVGMHAAEGITLRFDVKNPVASNVALVYHMSINEFPLIDGKAVARLEGMDALYAKIYYGEKWKNIYLQDGDDVAVSFDAADFDGSFTVNGGNGRAIDYLNKIQLVGLPDAQYALPWADFKKAVEGKMASMKRLLGARKFARSDKFRKMEEGRITYFYANSMLMYPTGHRFLTQDTAFVLGDDYYGTLRSYVREDNDLADIDEYRNFMIEAAHVFDEEGRNIRQVYPKTLAEIAYLGENVKSDKLREALVHHLAFTYVEGNGIDDIVDLQNLYYTYVASPRLNAMFKQACAKWDKAAVGHPTPWFNGVGIDGKAFTPKDFRGKYIYIDVWATWCGPCKKELPFLKSLEEKFKGRNISFVSLSIDSDKAKWEERVRKGDLGGTQLYIGKGTQFQRDYKVETIPRFILLDPEGRIVNPDMTRPSSADTGKMLDGLPNL